MPENGGLLLRGHECVGEGDQIKLGVETRLIPVERSLEYLLDAGDPKADQNTLEVFYPPYGRGTFVRRSWRTSLLPHIGWIQMFSLTYCDCNTSTSSVIFFSWQLEKKNVHVMSNLQSNRGSLVPMRTLWKSASGYLWTGWIVGDLDCAQNSRIPGKGPVKSARAMTSRHVDSALQPGPRKDSVPNALGAWDGRFSEKWHY